MSEPVTLEELKAWARVDDDTDDTLIASLDVAAREYIETATGKDLSSDGATVPEKAKVAIKSLAAHWYEERTGIVVGAPVARVPNHVRSLINQLKDWTDPALVDEASA